MKIGIDISQIVYEGTGVARYVKNIVLELVKNHQHEYILFASSWRTRSKIETFCNQARRVNPDIKIVLLPFPPIFLDILWNRLHIIPVESFTGEVDIFWSSDWAQPPLKKAVGVTTVFDIIYLLFPAETQNRPEVNISKISFRANIVQTQKRRMDRVRRECSAIICDSQSAKNDLVKYLKIKENKIFVVYPGIDI